MKNGYILTIINAEGDEKSWVQNGTELLTKINESLANESTFRCIVERPRRTDNPQGEAE